MLDYEVEPRLILRHLDLPDAKQVFAAVDANRAYLRKWLPWVDSNSDVSHSESFIMHTRRNFAERKSLPFGIFLDAQFVGHINFFDIDWENKSAEIGYWLSEDASGKGIITKCCRAMIAHCFDVLGLKRIIIRAHVDNKASRAVAERLGFTLEGISRHAAYLYGLPIDYANYALIADESGRDDVE